MKPEGDVPGPSLTISTVTSRSLSKGATKTAQPAGREGKPQRGQALPTPFSQEGALKSGFLAGRKQAWMAGLLQWDH